MAEVLESEQDVTRERAGSVKRLLTAFNQSWEGWRRDFKKEAEAGKSTHMKKIETALIQKTDWEMNLLDQAKSGKGVEADQIYAEIQKAIASLGNVPSTISVQNNANKILNNILASKPQVLDNRLLEQGLYSDVQFFIDELSKAKYDDSNIEKMSALTASMEERSKQMAVLQTLDSLWSIPLAFEDTIKEQNKALDEQLSSQLMQDSFMKVGAVYIRPAVDKLGNPNYQILPTYAAYDYKKPDRLPTVKDANGKEWDLTNFTGLQGKDAPTSAELNVMVRLAKNKLDYDFKQVFDPDRMENREIGVTLLDPKAMARVAKAAQQGLQRIFSDPQQALQYSQADEDGKAAMVESAKNSGYLVGPTVGGSFGSHHFSQFYPILKLKEMYNEQKAEGEALKGDGFANAVGQAAGAYVSFMSYGMIDPNVISGQVSKFMHENKDTIDTVVTVAATIAVAAVSVVGTPFTGGASLAAGAAIMGGLAAYKAAKGAYEGGIKGAVLGAASVYTQAFGVTASYTYEDGFGVNVGVEQGALSAGASYTEKGGFGVNASMEVAGVFSVGASYSQNEGFGASLGVSYGGNADGTGTSFNAGISYTQKGGVGGNVGASNNGGLGKGVTSGGQLTYSKQKGYGASASASYKDPSKSANAKNTPNASKPVSAQRPNNMSGSGMSFGYSQKEGFEASLDVLGANAFNWSEVGGLTGNTNYMVDKYRADKREEIEQEKTRKEKLVAEGEEKFVNEWKKDHKGDADLTKEQIFAKYAEEQRIKGAPKDKSRTNLADHAWGFVEDNFLNYGGSNSQTYLNEKDEFRVKVCFVAGTKVHSKDGLKNIEEIQIGDIVLSKSDVTGEVSYRQVVNTFIRQADAIYKVAFADGTVLETTWNHPFRVLKDAKDKEFNIENTQWTQAKDLVSGDVALSAEGAKLQIVSIEIDDRAETVYNFEVEDFHTYFVGEVGVWVHNAEYRNLSMGYSELVLSYTQNGKDYQGHYHEVGQKEKGGTRTFLDKDTNSVLRMDKDGNTTRYYKDRYGNNIEEDFSFKENSLTDREKMRINGRDMSDGSIVRIDKKGLMTVMTQEEMAKVKNATAFVNGMKMKYESSTDAAQFVREKVKMQGDLYLYNNGTQGPGVDVVKVAMGQNSQKETGYEKAQDKLRDSLKSGQINTVYSYSQGSVIAGNAFQQAAADSGSKNFYENKKWVSLGGGHVSQNIPTGLKNATFYTNTTDMISNGAPLLSDIIENVSNGTLLTPPRNLVKRFITERQEGRNGSYNSSCISANPLTCHSIYNYEWALNAEGSKK
jgi:hypothetical protein